MNVLVTLNSSYIRPLKVMLKSLFLSNTEERFCIYLMQSSLTPQELEDVREYIEMHGSRLEVITLDNSCFTDAPVLLHYTKEMYYRLLAFKFLPRDMDRILYLDPDILVINKVGNLYETDLEGYLYAAAYHDVISVKEFNKLRLNSYDMDAYYNSGVLLMNLRLQREQVEEQAIYEFVEKNKVKLIMPDQDILNALYAKKILGLDEKLYNYDARFYRYYKLTSNGLWDMDHVIRNTVFIHFCGKKKPWNKDYTGRFQSLYKHFERLAYPD
ncbi:MAG TPA: glycosyltransferase family 8 protein [Ruminiclostridium sp.]|jgi:lipopolysaccharide biosynthesis glycosyltransferase|nr:glycosyltransferase family 8 protein [Ruminiclostridium sp.]